MSVQSLSQRQRTDESENDEGNEEVCARVLTVEDEEMGEVIGSISSGTALDILGSVHDSPKVSTELAEELGMTTQNVRYHLDNLEEAGLVEADDACYSEKGRVMSVYEPSEAPLVLVFGGECEVSGEKVLKTR
jgi:DNA-binding transcriptional ArsR family regulator